HYFHDLFSFRQAQPYVTRANKPNLRLQPVSATKREISTKGQRARSTPAHGRAESVPFEAFPCLWWSVSSHALFRLDTGRAKPAKARHETQEIRPQTAPCSQTAAGRP